MGRTSRSTGARNSSEDSKFVFEPLERRILLSADPATLGAVLEQPDLELAGAPAVLEELEDSSPVAGDPGTSPDAAYVISWSSDELEEEASGPALDLTGADSDNVVAGVPGEEEPLDAGPTLIWDEPDEGAETSSVSVNLCVEETSDTPWCPSSDQGVVSEVLDYSAAPRAPPGSWSGPSDLTLRLDGAMVVLLDNDSGATVASQPCASTGEFIVSGTDYEDDTLTIDLHHGVIPIPITFHGGVAGFDSLVIQGGSFSTIRYGADGPDAGTISLDGMSLRYTGLEPITETAVVDDRVFSITTTGVDQQIRIGDDGDPNNGYSTIDSNGTGGFESITFLNPAHTLIVNAGDGNDTIILDTPDNGFSAQLTVNGEAGNDTLLGPAADATWHVTGIDTGSVSGVSFTGIENLVGAPENEDTFIYAAQGTTSGVVEGGEAGFDSIVLDGGTFDNVVLTATGADSGTIERDGLVIVYCGMEPISNSTVAGNQTIVLNGSADKVVVRDDSGDLVIESGDVTPTFESVTVTSAPSGKVKILAGAGNDTFVVQSVPAAFSDKLELGGEAGNDTYKYSAQDATIRILEDPSGGTDTLDFTGYPGTIKVSGGTVTGYDTNGPPNSTVTFPAAHLETIVHAGKLDITSLRTKLLNGLEQLVDWARELSSHDKLGIELPILSSSNLGVELPGAAGGVGVGVGSALEIAEALDQIRLKIWNQIHDLTTVTTQDLLAAVGGAGGFVKNQIEHLDRAIIGSAINPTLSGSETLKFKISVDGGAEIEINPPSIDTSSDPLATLATNINSAITGTSALSGKVQAVVTEGRIAFQAAPDFSSLSVKGVDDAISKLGFRDTAETVVAGVLQELGDLKATASGVTLTVEVVNGTPELKLGFHYDARRNDATEPNAFGIDLGKIANEDLGISFDTNAKLKIDSRLQADLAVGLELDATPAFFLDVSNLGVTADLNATNLTFALNVGFLGASLNNGAIEMHAGLGLTFQDPSGDGATRLSVAELNTTTNPLSSLANLSVTANSLTNLDLPIVVTSGLGSSFTGDLGVKIVLDTLDPSYPPDLFSGDLLNSPLPVKLTDVSGLNDIPDLDNFNNTSVSGILSLLRQLGNWLDDLGGSERFTAYGAPLLDKDLSDVLDFADMIQDALMFDDHDDDNDATYTEKLLDKDGNATFTNAQEFASRLAAILPLDLTGVGANYNPTDDTLTYNIDLSNTFANVDLPLDFNLDLSPLLDIENNTSVTLQASGSLTLKIGMYLGAVPSGSSLTALDVNTTLDSLDIDVKTAVAVTTASSVGSFIGRLSDDALFTITIGGTDYRITVSQADTLLNETADHLRADIHTALTKAYNTSTEATENLTSQVSVSTDGERIKLSSSADFSLAALSSDPAVKEIGLSTAQSSTRLALVAASAAVAGGSLSDDAVFDLSVTKGGSPKTTKVTVVEANTTYNASLDDLVDDVTGALAAAGLGGQIRAVKDGTKIKLVALDGSITAFTLSAGASDPAHTELGFGTSASATQGSTRSLHTLTDLRSLVPRLSDDAQLSISVEGGTALPVTIDRTATEANRNLADVVNDLNEFLGVASLKSGSLSTFTLGSNATFNVTVNGTGGAVPVTVPADTTDGTAYVAFNGTAVDTAADTLTIGSHTYLSGQSVTYTDGGDTGIGGLTDTGTYYVIVVDTTTVKLASTRAEALAETAVDLTAAGSGTNHRLTETANATIGDIVDDVNRALNGTSLSGQIRAKTSGDSHLRIEAIDEFVTDFRLTASGSAATELKLPADETVARLDGVILADSMGDKLVLTADAPTATFDGSSTSAVKVDDDILQIGAHDFVTGRAVQYSRGTGGSSIGTSGGGLTDGGTYYVIRVTPSTVQLATSGANALSGTAIDLTAVGTGTEHALTASPVTGFTVTTGASDTAKTELGFGTSQAANKDDLLIFPKDGSVNGGKGYWPVFLDGATDLGVVIERIVNQTNGSGTLNRSDPTVVAGLSFGDIEVAFNSTNTGLILKDRTTVGTTLFHVELTNDSSAAIELGILRADENADQNDDGVVNAADGDGVIEGALLAGVNPADRFFVENAQVKGTFRFSGTVDASATFGFVGISLSGTAELHGEISAALQKPPATPGGTPTPGGRLTLNELINGLDNVRDYVAVPTVTGKLPGGKLGKLVVTLDLEPDLVDIFIGSLPSITVTVDNIGNPFAENVFSSPTYVGSDEFTVAGDQTAIFAAGSTISVESSPAVAAKVLKSSYDGVKTSVQLVSGVLTKTLSKITAPTPPAITLPDLSSLLGDLAKFDGIEFDDILAALKQLLNFLTEFEKFNFLKEKIPIINKSVHDLMGFVDRFSDALDEVGASPSATLQLLESAILDALGLSGVTSLFGLADGLERVSDTQIRLAGDVTAQFTNGYQVKIGSTTFTVASAAFAAGKTTITLSGGTVPSSLSGLDVFVNKLQEFTSAADGLQRLADNKFKLSGDLRDQLELGSKIDLGSGILSSVKNIVYDAASNTTEVLLFDNVLTGALSTLTDLDISPDFIDFVLDSSGGIDVLRINLKLVTGFNESLNVEIPNFIDLGSALGGLVDLAGAANLSASGSIVAKLDLGIGLDSAHLGNVYVYDTTGLEANLTAGGSNLTFRAAIGPVGLSISNGSATLKGSFHLDLKDSASIFTNHRASIGAIFSGSPLDNIALNLGGSIDVKLPTFFPREADFVGNITLNVPDLSTFLGNLSGVVSQFNYTDVLNAITSFDFSKFNIFDNILLAVDGIDLFLSGLQSLLEGDLFGFKLPVIGNALAKGGDFIGDLRGDFVAPVKKLIEEAEDLVKDFVTPSKNVVSNFLFDVLGSSGKGAAGAALSLLIKENSSGDPILTGGKFTPVDGPADIKLGGHQQLNDYLFNPDTTVTRDQLYIEWDMKLGQSYSLGEGFNLDLGIPGLGLETEGEIKITLTWELDFGFGISFADGPYLIISDADELKFTLDVDLSGTSLTGKLGFLQLSATVNPATAFGAAFIVDIANEKDPSDTRLGFTEIGSIDLDAAIAADAFLDLALELELNRDLVGASVASGFPSLTSDFLFDWGIGDRLGVDPGVDDFLSITDPRTFNAIKEGLKLVEFQAISLDLGSFVSDVLGPIVSKVQDVTEPIQPLIDVFTSPIPVLKDLGIVITFLDIAAAYGNVNPALIYAIADIITFVNSIPNPDEVGALKLPFGNFTVFDDGSSTHRRSGGGTYEPQLWDSSVDLNSQSPESVLNHILENAQDFLTDTFGDNWFTDTVGTLIGEAAEIMEDAIQTSSASQGGFAFPILEDPNQVFGLLMGRPAVLVTYDMPPLEFEFDYSQFIPIWGPLGVSINGEIGVTIDFAFGYDTLGIQQFIESDFRDFLALFNGFYVSDTDLATGDFGKDVPEVKVEGGLWAAAEVNLVVARAGVGGGVFFEVNFDLNDPDKDGRVRIGEIAGNVANQLKAPDLEDRFLAPLAMFDVSGRLFAKLFAFLKIDLFLFKIDKEWNITPEAEILSFDIDFYRPPQLASVQTIKDGGADSSSLQLNMGEFADRRLNGDLSDGGETLTVTGTKSKLTVSGFGATLDYEPEKGSFSKILAIGGEGNDVIDLSGVTDASIAVEVEGGAGNDIIKTGAGPALIRGGSGDDEIWGGSGDDQIFGGKGQDEIHTGGGSNLAIGDEGEILEDSIRVKVNATDGADRIFGDSGKDILIGGGGNDTIDGGGNDDVIIGDGAEIVFSSPKTADHISEINDTERDLTAGNDILLGGAGADEIYGGRGEDIIDGGGGGDSLYGQTGRDTIYGGSGRDTIYGGTEDDTIYGFRDPSAPAGKKDGSDSAADGIDTIYGEEGKDEIHGGDRGDVIHGGAGADLLYGDAGADKINGDGGPDLIIGGEGNDTIDGGASSDVIFGDDGPDDYKTTGSGKTGKNTVIFGRNVPELWTDAILTADSYFLGADGTKSVSDDDPTDDETGDDVITSGIGADFLDGQGGNDTYIIRLQGADKDARLNVHDSGESDAETDIFYVYGTVFDDEFLIRASVSLNGLAFVALINDDPYVERVNYWNLERIVVETSLGDDFVAVDDVLAEMTINGSLGDDRFQVGQIYRSQRNNDPKYANVAVDDIFATIETTRGWLSNGISRPMTINGGVGNDNFIVFHNKDVLTLNGEDGDDTFLIKAFALAGSQEPIRDRTDVSGGAGADLVQYAMNAPVNIDGGDGFDTVIIIGTEFGDDFVVTEDGVFGAGLNVNFVNIESLQVDGAEGDDRFYVLSTSEKFITQIAGGLGSDTFSMAGDTPPVVSNDLRGHSGVIVHDVETVDPLYKDTAIDGISANIADDDVSNVVVITETLGATLITEGGSLFEDSYSLVLARKPDSNLIVQVLAPLQSEDQKELGSKAFRLFSYDAVNNTSDWTSLSLEFTPSNWDTPQIVYVGAPDNAVDELDYDDGAIEGTRTGVINHFVANPTTIKGQPDSLAETKVGEIVVTKLFDLGVTFPHPSVEDLTGLMVLITDGPGAGQTLRIKSYTQHELVLFGRFSKGYKPDTTSTYIVTKDVEATRSINVTIRDNDAPGVAVTETAGSTEVFEGGATDTIQVSLPHQPTDDIEVTLSGAYGQLVLTSSEAGATNNPDGSVTLLFPTATWKKSQTVTLTAKDDIVREGFHFGLITFAVDSVNDLDVDKDVTETDSLTLTTPTAFVGLSHKPKNAIVEYVKVNPGSGWVTRPPAEYDVVSNKVIFKTTDGDIDFVTGSVEVRYKYVDPGYEGLQNNRSYAEPPVLIPVADDDVAQVRITESNGSTDVIENLFVGKATAAGTSSLTDTKASWNPGELVGLRVCITAGAGVRQIRTIASNTASTFTVNHPWIAALDTTSEYQIFREGIPWSDTYDVVLTRQPDQDVKVVVSPKDTKTTSGKIVYLEKQVLVSSSAPGAKNNPDGTVTLLFTTSNWDSPQTVKVVAIDDGQGDGDDTQVFPPLLHTVGGIQGPLFIYGESGKGSLISFEPLMLPYELNIKPETGDVADINASGDELKVFKKDIEDLINGDTLDDLEKISDLVDNMRTVEITEGPAIDQFRLIEEIEDVGEKIDGKTVLTLKVNLPYTLEQVTFDGSSTDAVSTSTDLLRIGEHNFVTGQSAAYSNGGGTDIGGLTDGTVYYVIKVSSTLVKLATTKANALADNPVNLTGLGQGSAHQLSERYADNTKYAITAESPTFWAIEEEQIDYLFLNNEDSPADNVIPTRAGALFDASTVGYDDNGILEEFVTKLDGKRITGLGMGGDLIVGGILQPGGITYGDLEVVEINLGRGVDHFTVNDTHTRADGFQTWTILNTGDEPAITGGSTVPGDGDKVWVSLDSEEKVLTTGSPTSDAPADTTLLADDGASFPTAGTGLEGFIVEIVSGDGAGQRRVIESNTETELTVDRDWGTDITTSSVYRIVNPVIESGQTTTALADGDDTLVDTSATFDSTLVGRVLEITEGPAAGIRKEIVKVKSATELQLSSDWAFDTAPTEQSDYRIFGEVDGPIAINTQGGDDWVDGSASSIPLVIFGGDDWDDGDTLVGGSADDMIFGDRGRVEYFDETGAIVTRHGIARELNEPRFVTGVTNNTLSDSGADFPTENGGLVGLYVRITDGRGFGQRRLITANTATTLTVSENWEKNPLPGDENSAYDPSDPNNNASKYRISLIPEDQTDGVVRGPLLVITRDPETGGTDSVKGMGGGDILIGGAGGDDVFGDDDYSAAVAETDDGSDIVIGDHVRIDFTQVRTDTPDIRDRAATLLKLVETIDFDEGASDTLRGNAASDVMFGGVAGDTIYGDDALSTAGSADGGDFIVGDNGEVQYIGGVLAEVRSTDTSDSTGGADTIHGNEGNDLILGGVNGSSDEIHGDEDADIIIGDDGEFLFDGDERLGLPAVDLSTLDFARTFRTDVGGKDVIYGDGADDIILGATGGDEIHGGTENDVVLGDFAEVRFLDNVARLAETKHHGLGGADTIYGDAGEDALAGGDDGDSIDGGSEDDLILGDNVRLDRWDAATYADETSPRFQALEGTRMYSDEEPDVGEPLVDGVPQLDPSGVPAWASWDIFIDKSDAESRNFFDVYGNDSIAGGAHDDTIFGQLGDDVIQGDGSILLDVGTLLDPKPSVDDLTPSDGDDYIEGNGGSDLIFGNLGQDDIIGGSSDQFSLTTPDLRSDGADHVFGGSGTQITRNDAGGSHGRDADFILGDNGDIFRLVGTGGVYSGAFLTFNYDDYTDGPRIIPRAVDLLDYTPGGDDADMGDGDLIRGEGGDDSIHGMTGNDALFGDGQDDDIFGEAGGDWISGGVGQDGILGDDGLIFTSRNDGNPEPLYGIGGLNGGELNREISTPGNIQLAKINLPGELKKTVDLIEFDVAREDTNDIIFGGLGGDFIHAGDGDDAVSGAEALPEYYNNEEVFPGESANEFLITQQEAPPFGEDLVLVPDDPPVAPAPFWFDFAPSNPGDVLRFEGNLKPDEFALYDEFEPRRKVLLTEEGELYKGPDTGTFAEFLLNFDPEEGPPDDRFADAEVGACILPTDGDDRIFGDLGNDWIVGGSGRDHMYGGRGRDLLNADDDHESADSEDLADDPLANDEPDPFQAYADIFYGGGGRDVLILNTGADRSIDWVGEFNSYIVPFRPFGAFHISRSLQPQLEEFLYDLSAADGADQTAPDAARNDAHQGADSRIPDPQKQRNFEPYGELGLVLQKDFDWREQTGAPGDPQPGNDNGNRIVLRRELFDSTAPTAFAPDVGTWTLSGGRYEGAAPRGSEAVSLYFVDEELPRFMEVLVMATMERQGAEENAFVIFDYWSETSFKFAGVVGDQDLLVIGHRTEGGWVYDAQVSMKLRTRTEYELEVFLQGTLATVKVGDTQQLHDFRDLLSDGMVGLGTENAVSSFDNMKLLQLPRVITFEFLDDFADGVADMLTEETGTWAVDTGQLSGAPLSGEDAAIATMELDVSPNTYLELEALITTESLGGFVFDLYGTNEFKFAALLAGSDQVVIGHRTYRGWFFDAFLSQPIDPSSAFDFGIKLEDATVTVTLGGEDVLSHTFHSALSDGDFGLLSWSGVTTFDDVVVRSDDPALAVPPPPPLPLVSVSDATVTEGDSGSVSALVAFTLSEVAPEPVTVDYTSTDGSATAGEDYQASGGTVTFAPGETSAQVAFLVSGDDSVEPDETFQVELSQPVGVTIADGTGVVTILNDDAAPPPAVVTVSATDASAAEEGPDTGAFVVNRSVDLEGDLAVALAWSGVAVADDDFTVTATGGVWDPLAGTLTLAGGVDSATLTITPLDDTTVEGAEDVVVTVTPAAGYDVGSPASAAVTIADNDVPAALPSLSISDAEITEGDKRFRQVTLTITLSEAAAHPVTVTVSTRDGTAAGDEDYRASVDTITLDPGVTSQEFAVSVKGDKKAEGDEWFTVELSSPSGALLADGSGLVTIVGDDGANLLAAEAPVEPVADELGYEELSPIVDAAMARWADVFGTEAFSVKVPVDVTFEIVDLEGLTLGRAVGSSVLIDVDAAGHGWFIDRTPTDDGEYLRAGSDGELLAASSSPAFGRTDLLTAVLHELGHVVGLADLDGDEHSGDLMGAKLETGVRRLVASDAGSPPAAEESPRADADEPLTPDGIPPPSWLSGWRHAGGLSSASALATARPHSPWWMFVWDPDEDL